MELKKLNWNTYFLILLSIFLTACTTTLSLYRYTSYPDSGFNNSYNKILDISGRGINIEKEDSAVEIITVYDRQYKTFAKIINPTIQVIDKNGKSYIVKIREDKEGVNIYEQGVILEGEFKAYIGKVRRKDGSIVNVPPLVFKQYVDINKFNPVMGAMNINTKKEVFSGTVEEYKKGNWKETKRKNLF